MILKSKIILILLIFNSIPTFTQPGIYQYKRRITDSAHTWSKIVLPDDIYDKFKDFPNDLRIYGQSDTIENFEVPYILFDNYANLSEKEISFKILNQSVKDSSYYITFENSFIESLNRIELKFDRANFDWEVTLEGSHNRRDWFTILTDYRILSISNPSVFYSFTTLNFPDSDYLYFRVKINTSEDPKLAKAFLYDLSYDEGYYKTRPVDSVRIQTNHEIKQTVVDVYLKNKAPVSSVFVEIKNKFDFYRPVKVLYMVDTVVTASGIKPHFRLSTSGYLTSVQENIFTFDYKLTDRIRIQIENYDNNPLDIGNIDVKGNICSLTCRFPEGRNFYLFYGSEKATRPRYDIDEFTDKIPVGLTTLNIGEEEPTYMPEAPEIKTKSIDRLWLWIVMGTIVIVIGAFSISMLKTYSRK